MWTFFNVCVTVGAVTDEPSRSTHLSDRVEARIAALGFSPTTLAEATGLTPQGLLNVRNGVIRKYQRRTTLPLTKALKWTPDSIERLLRGEEPIELEPADELPQPEAADVVDELATQLARLATDHEELKQEVKALARQIARATRRAEGGGQAAGL